MSKKMFVGNLSFQSTEDELRSVFERFGNVESVKIITDRDTGRSKGFGFVEMSEGDADKAIADLSGTSLDGRALTVNEARPVVKREFGSHSTPDRGASRFGDNARRSNRY